MAAGMQEGHSAPSSNSPASLATVLALTQAPGERGQLQGSPAQGRGATVPFLQLRDHYRSVSGRVDG